MNIVLMAGGGGTRLWPLSRKNQPKQFLEFGGGKTLIEQTYARACAVTAPENIYVATIKEYEERIRQLLPDLPQANLFLEPERRDNAAAFAAVAVQLCAQGQGDEPAVFMWSDHVFTAEADYLEDLKKIPGLIASNRAAIVIVGHTPSYPETGFGYIEAGQAVDGFDDVFEVVQFKEKPDVATAERYVQAGNYYWNMGSISMHPRYLLEELQRQSPEFVEGVARLEQAFKGEEPAAVTEAYRLLPQISIDYALLEKAPRILVVTGDYGWNDIGNWAAVQEIFGSRGDHQPTSHHIHVDSHNNYVYNATDKVVSVIGVKNTIVVVTKDAVLVTDKQSSHKVKDVVAQLEAAGKDEYL